jgi:hypothetical protein
VRTNKDHIRNADFSATVVSREPLFYSSPGAWNYGQPVKHGDTHVHIAHLSCGHAIKDAELGAVVICNYCKADRESLTQIAEAIKAGIVSHSRASRFGDHDTCCVYRYDSKSPTGVLHLASCDFTPEADALLRGGLSALSPTESR